MGQVLTTEALAARKAELCAEADKLRREFRDNTDDLKPLVNLADVALDAAGLVRLAAGIGGLIKRGHGNGSKRDCADAGAREPDFAVGN